MLECSTWDRGVVCLSLSGGTILLPCAIHVIIYLVLVQPRICPDMTDIFWLGCKISTSNNRGPQLLSASVRHVLKGLLFGEGTMMELRNVLFSAKYWFNLDGQGTSRHDWKMLTAIKNQRKITKETLISKLCCSCVRLLVHRFIFSMLLD